MPNFQEIKSKKILAEVFAYLKDLGGFNDWFEDVDDSTKRAIQKDLLQIIKKNV